MMAKDTDAELGARLNVLLKRLMRDGPALEVVLRFDGAAHVILVEGDRRVNVSEDTWASAIEYACITRIP